MNMPLGFSLAGTVVGCLVSSCLSAEVSTWTPNLDAGAFHDGQPVGTDGNRDSQPVGADAKCVLPTQEGGTPVRDAGSDGPCELSGSLKGEVLWIASDQPPPVADNRYHTFTVRFRITETDCKPHVLTIDLDERVVGELDQERTGFWGDVEGPTCGNLTAEDNFQRSIMVREVGEYELVSSNTGFCVQYPADHDEAKGGIGAISLFEPGTKTYVSDWKKLGLITPECQ